MMKANLAAKLLPRLSKSNLQGVRINSCEPNGLLIVDKDTKFTISKQSSLSPPRFGTKREARFQPRILQQNAMLAFTSCAFQRQNVKFASSLKLCKNARTRDPRSRQDMTLACESR